jgi:hypothetical protein
MWKIFVKIAAGILTEKRGVEECALSERAKRTFSQLPYIRTVYREMDSTTTHDI